MDVGHAHMLGDAAEAIETTSEYLVTTHIHDNRRQSDDHLVPFQGSIELGRRDHGLREDRLRWSVDVRSEERASHLTPCSQRAVSARKRLEALMMDDWNDLAGHAGPAAD